MPILAVRLNHSVLPVNPTLRSDPRWLAVPRTSAGHGTHLDASHTSLLRTQFLIQPFKRVFSLFLLHRQPAGAQEGVQLLHRRQAEVHPAVVAFLGGKRGPR